jgi:hypothetical protein
MPRLPLVLALLVSVATSAAEIPISAVRYVPGSNQYTRRDPVVLTHGDGFLVTWEQALFGAYYPAIVARSYDADGNPRGPEEVNLGTAGLVWTGEHYLAIETVSGGRWGISFPQPQVYVRRLNPDLTAAAPVREYFTGTRGSRLFSVAWNGTHAAALVVLDHKRLLLFDRDGALVSDTPVEANVTTIAPQGDTFLLISGTRRMHVTEGNGRYALTDRYGEAAHLTILDASGVETDRVPIAGARSTSWDGSRWHTATVDADGRVCTSDFTRATDVRTKCRVIADAKLAAIGAIPGRTLLAWLGADEQIVTDNGIASMARVFSHALASAVDATGLLLAWQQDGNILLGGITTDGLPRREFLIPNEGPYGEGLKIAPNGDVSLLVWRRSSEIFAMRLTAEGAPLHPILALGTGADVEVVPVADGWLVAQTSEDRVYTTPISREAIVGTRQEIAAGAAVYHSVLLAAVPDGALVIWAPWELTHRNAQRVDRNGIPVGMANRIEQTTYPALACSATACLVPTYSVPTIDALLLDFDGRPLGEPKPMLPRVDDVIADVVAMPDGSFRVYTARDIAVVGPDGTPRGVTRWSDQSREVAGVEVFEGRTYLFYTRDGRVYLRDLRERSRAVRH